MFVGVACRIPGRVSSCIFIESLVAAGMRAGSGLGRTSGAARERLAACGSGGGPGCQLPGKEYCAERCWS